MNVKAICAIKRKAAVRRIFSAGCDLSSLKVLVDGGPAYDERSLKLIDSAIAELKVAKEKLREIRKAGATTKARKA